MIDYANLIRYKRTGNSIYIHWTDQAKDLLISAQCWPKKGYHAGCYNAAQWLMDQEQFDKNKIVMITGISMGGSIAEVLGALLADKGFTVMVIVKGAFPVSLKKKKLSGKVDIYGNDPVPALFPWFKHTVLRYWDGPFRWFPLFWRDHRRY